MNICNYRNMQKTLDKMYDYWFDLQDEFGLEKDDHAPFTIYTTSFYEKHTNDEIEYLRSTDSTNQAFMTTLQYCLGDNDPKNDDCPENNIILDMYAHVYMSYEHLFELVMDCNMNWDNVLLCLKHALRHELGHILYARKTFIGKKYGDWVEYVSEGDKFYSTRPKLRKNASLENRKKYMLEYMQGTS